MSTRTGLRVAALAAGILALGVFHFSVGVTTSADRLSHVGLGGFNLLLIIAASLWFGLRGGAAATLAVSTLFLVHLRTSWSGSPEETANQYAMLGVYLVVGLVTGALVERERRERSRRLEAERRAQREAIVQGLSSLSSALGLRDEHTREHCARVARLAVAMGERLGLRADSLDLLRLAGLAHDLGKIGVRDDILLNPEELTGEERAAIQRHPAYAAEILGHIQGTEEIARIVLCHHECPDGSGYPQGLRGEEVPLEARVLRVADVFSALSEARSYKAAIDENAALAQMRPLRGTKLDAESFDALERAVGAAPAPEGAP